MKNMCQHETTGGSWGWNRCTAGNSSRLARKCTFYKKKSFNRQCIHVKFNYVLVRAAPPTIECSCDRACEMAYEEYSLMKKMDEI